MMPGLMSSFSGSRPTYGSGPMSTHRSGNWKDESTLGAPGEDPEYGAGDPEHVLALVPGGGFQYGEKNRVTNTTSATDYAEHQSQHQYQHQHSSSESSSPLRK